MNSTRGPLSARIRTSDVVRETITKTLIRVYSRIIRDIKRSTCGIESYLTTEDRWVLEQVIFPYFIQQDEYKNILFVVCHWYTKGYDIWFETKKNYWTIEPNRWRQRYGARQHISDTLQNLGNHFGQSALDLIFCNGVIGYMAWTQSWTRSRRSGPVMTACVRGEYSSLVGLISTHDAPFTRMSAKAYASYSRSPFRPLATAKYVTDTPLRVTYNFYVKLSGAAAG